MGTISNIATEINANGQATSAITFRTVRTIYDEDPYAFKPDEESLYPHAIRSTSNDIIPTLHDFLYKSEYYGTTEIGRDFYSYIILGTKAKPKESGDETTFESVSKEGEDGSDSNPRL